MFQLDYIDVGTPLSNKHYLGQPEGEIYGLHHARQRFLPEYSMYLRPKSGIPGLYLTGNVSSAHEQVYAGSMTLNYIERENCNIMPYFSQFNPNVINNNRL